MNIRRLTRYTLLCMTALTLVGSGASAVQDGNTSNTTESILLSPTDKRYNIEAGATVRDSFEIVNDGPTEFNFVTYTRPYSVRDETYEPDFTTQARNADAYRWVQFDESSYAIEPGQTKKVEYTIRVPENATPGGHYGVLFAETQPNDDVEGTSVLRSKRVGAIMYVTVKGDVSQSGQLKSATVPLFQFSSPLNAGFRVENKGNTDFTVTSKARIFDVFGGLKYKVDKEVAVLPGTTRAIDNSWQNPSWIGVYKVEQAASFLDTDRTTTNYVILIPAWIYLVVILLIGGRVAYALVRRKRNS